MGVGATPADLTGLTTGSLSASDLRARLEQLRAEVIGEGDRLFAAWESRIERERYAASALNLARYIALRRNELRDLQLELMPWGLSSLGRCEARVIESIEAVIGALDRIDAPTETPVPQPQAARFFRGHELLREETEAALGPTPANRSVRMMVTLPSEAAEDRELVSQLVRRGMDIARINCGHDDAEVWRAMANQVREAAREVPRSCAVCLDICGPRARTDAVAFPSELSSKSASGS